MVYRTNSFQSLSVSATQYSGRERIELLPIKKVGDKTASWKRCEEEEVTRDQLEKIMSPKSQQAFCITSLKKCLCSAVHYLDKCCWWFYFDLKLHWLRDFFCLDYWLGLLFWTALNWFAHLFLPFRSRVKKKIRS